MNTQMLLNIKKDHKVYEYLHQNSHYYRTLNRNYHNYQEFIKKYKKYNHEKQYRKVNDLIDNVDMLKDIINIVE